MNPLQIFLLAVNPVVTAGFAFMVFFESKKAKASQAAIESAVRDSSKLVIESIQSQKQGFDSIAESLSAISNDQEKSVETFTGISEALITASKTNKEALSSLRDSLTSLSKANAQTYENLANSLQESHEQLGEKIKKNSEELAYVSETLKSLITI
jgi:ABC-type transporter Mla subunit MlaD